MSSLSNEQHPPNGPHSNRPVPSIARPESTTTHTRTPSHSLARHRPDEEDVPPTLNYTLQTPARERWIALFFGLLFVESGILPLILFYSLRWGARLSIAKNLAIITSLIGTVSGLKVAQRTYFLWFKHGHETRRPIGAGRWGLDFFHILINVSLAAFFVPLVVGSSLSPASVPVVAMALPCFMLTICIPMAISSVPPSDHFQMPFRVSSFPPRHPLPPLTYTIVEDVIAVDGSGGLEFRQAWRHRYESSRVMRKLVRDVALGWGFSGLVVAGAVIAVAWTTSDDIGYGIGYGIPWLWAFVCTGVTIVWTERELRREKREWHDVVNVHREKPLHLVEGQVDREAFDRMLARGSPMAQRTVSLPASTVTRVESRGGAAGAVAPHPLPSEGDGANVEARSGPVHS